MPTHQEERKSQPIEIPIETDEDPEGAHLPQPAESAPSTDEAEPAAKAAESEPEQVPETAEKDERLLRLMAEFANFRKRVASEQEELSGKAKAELVKRLLAVLDAFQQMLQEQEVHPDAQALLDGARLIYKQLWESLAAEGLQRIEALEKPFDPMEHEAVLTQPVSDPKLDGVVVSVLQEGYRFRDQLLRPSQVVVGRYEESTDGRNG